MNDSQFNEDVAPLKLELELEKLERAWLQEKERHLTSAGAPTQAGWVRTGLGLVHPGLGIFVGGFVIFVGCVVFLKEFSPGLFLMIFGTIMVGAAAVTLWYQGRWSQTYNEAERDYENRRQQLLQDIEASKVKTDTKQDMEVD